MAGFPIRPALADFGPALINTKPVEDPERDASATIWNLFRAQVAGLGILSPRVMLAFTSAPTPAIVSRAEAWNPDQLTTGPYAPPTCVRNGPGDYVWTWPTPTQDQDGNSIAVAFDFAHGWVIYHSDPTTGIKHVQAGALSATPNKIRVARYDVASNALEEAGSILIFGW